MANQGFEVPATQLCSCQKPDDLKFETTTEVPPLIGVLGQDRALRALDYGLAVDSGDIHIYAAGPDGTGKMTAIRSRLAAIAANRPNPSGWCYVHNFDDPDRPQALRLAPPRGAALVQDMRRLVDEVKVAIPRVFESEDYAQRRNAVVRSFEEQRDQSSRLVQENARRQGFAIETTPMGIASIPLVEGRPMTKEEFEALPEEQRRTLEELGHRVKEDLEQAMRRGHQLDEEARERVEQLDRQVALFAIGQLIDAYQRKYADLPEVVQYLEAVRKDVPEHVDDFRRSERVDTEGMVGLLREDRLLRYRVNLFVDNSHLAGAPVVIEQQPTYYNLFGRIDYRSRLGSMVTDFTMIKPGAIHRANGGYLVLHARDVLGNPLVWDTLKRTLRSREARVENFGEQFTPIPSATIRPEPIPIDVKLVLVGPTQLYQVACAVDDDFRALFSVRADFDIDVDRTDERVAQYAAFISSLVQREQLKPFHKTGVARLIDVAVRLAGHQKRMSTRFAEVSRVIREASFWATRNNHDLVMGEDVNRALDEREYRSNMLEDRFRRLILEQTVHIATDGTALAQINGLSVIDLGDRTFGRPARITARVSLGTKGVVNIEREIELSGRIHSKGVLILANYLAGKYAQDKPLALSASLTFEQTYDEIEGDSASSAELYALLSNLANLPLKQGIAVTGAINQNGEVQAIGGVNEKIEGFYRICCERGLTGDQGVVIPRDNVKHLMLKDEVVQAASHGKFHIWAVYTVDEGIEILTGRVAGQLQADGTYPSDSVNHLVDQKLRTFAERLKEFRTLAAAQSSGHERVSSRHAARTLSHRKVKRQDG